VSCQYDCGDAIAKQDASKYRLRLIYMTDYNMDPSKLKGLDHMGMKCNVRRRYAAKFKDWQADGLNRPIELLFDDGEYLGWYNGLSHALDQDPMMVADYEKLGIVALPDGGRDWLSYTSMWRAKNTQTFKSGLLEVRSYILTTVINHTQMGLRQ